MNYNYILDIIDRIKIRQPDAVIVFGGPFLTLIEEDIMNKVPNLDFIVFGEGEITFQMLLAAIEQKENDFSLIDGIVWRDSKGNIKLNHPRDLITDLDKLPFPARDGFDAIDRDPVDGGISESVRVISSRGCAGNCSFCLVNYHYKGSKGKRWRGFSPKHVVDELEYLKKRYNAWLFNFSDSSFEDPGEKGKKRTREICEEIIQRELRISIKIYMRSESMKTKADMELLKLYKRAGIDVIIIGVEAASEYELKLYNKPAKVEDNFRIMESLLELDLFFVLNGFIMFGPNSSLETLKENIDYFNQFNPSNMPPFFNILILYKGTEIYQQLKTEGRIIEDIDTPWISPKYIFLDSKAERLAKHWENIQAIFPEVMELQRVKM